MGPTARSSPSGLVLLAFLLLCAAVATTGILFQPGTWYATLAKPEWTPPDWLFPPAWTSLYVMIAVAGWLVWRAAGLRRAVMPFVLYALQLVLNAAWSWLFFGLHRMDVGFFDIVALWLAILATLVAFYRVDRVAGLLLVPYLLWVSFAAALNLAIWQLNA